MAMRSARKIRSQPTDSEEDYDLASADCEMVLSKVEFEMLQAFHRFVPLPALTSRILRVYCEDDLQVPEASSEDKPEDAEASIDSSVTQRRENSTSSSMTGHILHHPCRPSNLKRKPHYQINLTSQTPRIQQQPLIPNSSRSLIDSDRSEGPETQD